MRKVIDYVYRKTVRFGAVASLAAVVALLGVVAPEPVAASNAEPSVTTTTQRYQRGHRDYTRAEVERIAVINGYSEGYEHGLIDRRTRRNFNFRHHREYQRAMEGWDNEYRFRGEYRSSFRDGYAKGYTDAFYGRDRNRGYDRSRIYDYRNSPIDPYANFPSYRRNPYTPAVPYYGNQRGDLSVTEVAQRAAANGYAAGFQRGQFDAPRRNDPNPQGHGAYQFALDGYNEEWGSASTYQQYYRSAFIRGYNDAFHRRGFDQRYNRNF